MCFRPHPNWVGQDHANGCGFAALAMIVGKTYAQVVAEFAGDAHPNGYRYNPDTGSPAYYAMDLYLAEEGFAVSRLYEDRFPHCRNEKRAWPPEPFAPLHLCNVKVYSESTRNHWVVMLADGAVLDPLTPEPRRLTDYAEVHNVAAVIPFMPPTVEDASVSRKGDRQSDD